MTILQNNIFLAMAALFVAVVGVNWAFFKILRIAKDKGLVDNPDARKLQKAPVPVVGGLAVFFGMLVGLLTGSALMMLPDLLLHKPIDADLMRLAPVLGGMGLMLYIGAMDDILGLTPKSRFFIEIFTILCIILATGQCVDSLHGLWGVERFSWIVAVPLTIFAGVGIVNALNMIDGVNGLSSGLCITCSVFYGVTFLKVDDAANAILAFSMVGALIPFFIHNVFGDKSKMFIGDAGTMVMGLLMAWFTISILCGKTLVDGIWIKDNRCYVALALAILSVPIADTLRVMTQRMIHGRSPFSPDKTHLHHAFVTVGVSHSITALAEIALDMLVVLIWAISYMLGASIDMQFYVVVIASVLLIWGTYAFLRYHSQRHTKTLHKLTHISIKTHLGYTDWWQRLTVWLDAPEERMLMRIEQRKAKMPHLKRRFDHIDPNDMKEQDRKRIVEFMKGRAEVFVEDIIRNSGASRKRVLPILQEEEENGFLKVIRRKHSGVPEIVYLIEG